MESKKWYQSKTIWGILIAALGYFMSTIGVDYPSLPENADFEQLKAYAEAIKAAQGNWSTIIGQVFAGVGTVVSIIGRFQAEAKVTA
jgi:ABC-type glycerol-3-phosphate transport system substrate-binding protein